MIPKGFPKKMSRSHNPYKAYRERFKEKKIFFSNKNTLKKTHPTLTEQNFNNLHKQEQNNSSRFLINTGYNNNNHISTIDEKNEQKEEQKEEAYEVAFLLKQAYDSINKYKNKYGDTFGVNIEFKKMTHSTRKKNKSKPNKVL
jgi:hypothetical protein